MMSLHSILRRFLPAVLPGVMAFSMAPAASDLPPIRPKVPSIHIPRLEAPPRLEDFMGMAPAEHLAGTMTMVTSRFSKSRSTRSRWSFQNTRTWSWDGAKAGREAKIF